MVQVLHGSAKTTQAVRRAIQHSQESIKALAAKYSINPMKPHCLLHACYVCQIAFLYLV